MSPGRLRNGSRIVLGYGEEGCARFRDHVPIGRGAIVAEGGGGHLELKVGRRRQWLIGNDISAIHCVQLQTPFLKNGPSPP